MRYSENTLGILDLWKNSFQVGIKNFFYIYFLNVILQFFTHIPKLLEGNAWFPIFAKQDIISVGILTLLNIVLSIFFSLILFHRLGTFMEGHPAKLIDSSKIALKKLPITLCIAVSVIFLVMLGFVLFILPGIYLLELYILIYPIILFDREVGPFLTLKKSFQLLWGNWWRTFVVVNVPILVVILLIAGLISGPWMNIFTLHSWISYIFYILILPVLSIFILPLYLLQWHDLKLRTNMKHLASVIPEK